MLLKVLERKKCVHFVVLHGKYFIRTKSTYNVLTVVDYIDSLI